MSKEDLLALRGEIDSLLDRNLLSLAMTQASNSGGDLSADSSRVDDDSVKALRVCVSDLTGWMRDFDQDPFWPPSKVTQGNAMKTWFPLPVYSFANKNWQAKRVRAVGHLPVVNFAPKCGYVGKF